MSNASPPASERYDPVDVCSMAALVFLTVGVACVTVGYLVPRDYAFDPTLAARRMESIEIYYARLSLGLDICIIAGVEMSVAGAVLLILIVVVMLVNGELCIEFSGDDDALSMAGDVESIALRHSATGQMVSYGSTTGRAPAASTGSGFVAGGSRSTATGSTIVATTGSAPAAESAGASATGRSTPKTGSDNCGFVSR